MITDNNKIILIQIINSHLNLRNPWLSESCQANILRMEGEFVKHDYTQIKTYLGGSELFIKLVSNDEVWNAAVDVNINSEKIILDIYQDRVFEQSEEGSLLRSCFALEEEIVRRDLINWLITPVAFDLVEPKKTFIESIVSFFK